jgi:hypothetical protein
MLSMEEIREKKDIMECINLEMTPEKAVSLYLEWGAFWAHGKEFIRSEKDVSCYFTIDAWKTPPQVLLIRRSLREGEVIGEVEVPRALVDRAIRYWGGRKGTYALSEELREWIRTELALN